MQENGASKVLTSENHSFQSNCQIFRFIVEGIFVNIFFQNNFQFVRINVLKVEVKQSRYRPGVAQRVPGSSGSQIS